LGHIPRSSAFSAFGYAAGIESMAFILGKKDRNDWSTLIVSDMISGVEDSSATLESCMLYVSGLSVSYFEMQLSMFYMHLPDMWFFV
jgi:hypothetical protein